MLMQGLYKLADLQHNMGKIKATVNLNARHPIFKGHYPGQPILPGACMLQIVKDTLGQALATPVMLSKASQIKFLHMVDPRENTEIIVSLNIIETDGLIKVSGNLVAGEKHCLKFSGSYLLGDQNSLRMM